ncbi:NnrU family protein [Aurantivibrio plasticivorans]
MELLIAGLVIFFAIHLVPTIAGFRTTLIAKLSAKGYKGLFAAVALIGLVLIVIGKGQAPFEVLYNPPAWGRHLTMLLVLIAFILFPAAHMKTNIKRVTRHPMLWGIAAWSVGHLLANGDKASVLLFGSFLVYSFFSMFSSTMRGAKKQTTKWPVKKDIVVFVAGLTVYIVFLFLHPYLFGYAVIPR